MEEEKTISNEQLGRMMSNLRIKSTIALILTYCGIAGIIISWFFLENLLLGVVFLVVTIIFAGKHYKYKEELKRILSDNIISGVLKGVFGDNVEYNPSGRVEPGRMMFPFEYNNVMGSDHIKAVYKGLNIELSDIELINVTESTDENGMTQTSSVSNFKGQWLICDFGKELSGEVLLSTNEKKIRKLHKKDNNIEMENEEFNKRFLVFASDAHEAYYILTPHLMEYIISMADKTNGEVYMSFLHNGKLHVAVKSGKDFFELGTSHADVEGLRQKFLAELAWFTDIVDTLRVEDSLYKKETNV